MILILGGSGYIGSEFVRCLQRRGRAYRCVSRRDCNYYDREQLTDLIDQLRPDFLINAAGFVGRPNVDACETRQTECLLGNAVLPGLIRMVCEPRNLAWGHVSTGCLYSGPSPQATGFRETDATNFCFRHNNCSFYSGCKALGEETLAGTLRCYVWRPRMPFSHTNAPKNYLSKVMTYDRLLDVRNSMSHLEEFVVACIECWEREVEFGTYHLTNTGSITTQEIVELVRRSGRCDKQYSFFASYDEFMQTAAVAPRSYCVLDNSKALNAGLRFRHVAEAIETSLRDWE